MAKELYDVKILYAEDEADIRVLLTSLLSSYVKAVVPVQNGQEAIEMLEKESFDIVITDINMPILNGLELCEIAKNSFPDLPFIITSAYSEVDMLLKAIDLGVSQYVLKPVKKDKLLKAISKSMVDVENRRLKKQLEIANTELKDKNEDLNIAYAKLKEANQKEIELFKYKERYHTLQQENAFKKQIKITKDELSYLYENGYIFASFFKPLDILSGDTYGSINLGEGRYLLYLVDAMGKGLSASVTAIQSISFINNSIELSILKEDFDLLRVLENFISYIKKQLLDDEILSALFLLLDTKNQYIEYSSFGMPPMLYQDDDLEVKTLDCNNPPIFPYYSTLKKTKTEFRNLQKLLIYSDGVAENVTKDGRLYAAYLNQDFKINCSKNRFMQKMESRIDGFDDDTTLFFIANIDHPKAQKTELVSKTDLYKLSNAITELEEILTEKIPDTSSRNKLFAAINEIAMNALEHGNIGISYDQKQELIKRGEFDEFIQESCSRSEIYEKDINITLLEWDTPYCENIAITFEDQGVGFSTPKILKSIEVHNETLFCGRGIKLANHMSDGVFYNKIGNKSLLLFTMTKENPR